MISIGKKRLQVISAMRGGDAQLVLEHIATPFDGQRIRRKFKRGKEWNGKSCTMEIVVTGEQEVLLEVALVLGRSEGLFLSDSKSYPTFSLKPLPVACGESLYTIPIGSIPIGRDGKKVQSRVRSIANSITACWVVRGFQWKNCLGEEMPRPHGQDPVRRVRDTLPRRRKRRSNLYSWSQLR